MISKWDGEKAVVSLSRRMVATGPRIAGDDDIDWNIKGKRCPCGGTFDDGMRRK